MYLFKNLVLDRDYRDENLMIKSRYTWYEKKHLKINIEICQNFNS